MTLLQTTPASPASAPPTPTPNAPADPGGPPDAFALIEAAHAQIAKTLVAATGEFAARTFKHQSSMELAREIGALTLSLARVAKMLEPPKEPRPSRRVSHFAERRAAHVEYFEREDQRERPAPPSPLQEDCDFPPMRMWSGGKLYRDEDEFCEDYRAARRARVQEKATERAKRDGIDYRAALDIEYAEWENARARPHRGGAAPPGEADASSGLGVANDLSPPLSEGGQGGSDATPSLSAPCSADALNPVESADCSETPPRPPLTEGGKNARSPKTNRPAPSPLGGRPAETSRMQGDLLLRSPAFGSPALEGAHGVEREDEDRGDRSEGDGEHRVSPPLAAPVSPPLEEKIGPPGG